MVAGLLALGHQVAVLARDHRGAAKAFTWHRVEDNGSSVYWLHHQLSDARSYRETWNDRRLLEPLRQIFADFEPEIVHLAHPDGWGIVPLELARQQDLSTGATLHDYKWLCARGQMLHPSGERCERIDEERCVRCIHDQLDGGGLRALARNFAPTPLLRWAQQHVQREMDRPKQAGRLARQRWRTGHIALLSSLRDCDLLVSPSRFVARRYQDSALAREVEVIANGLMLDDSEWAAPARRPKAQRWPFLRDSTHSPLQIGFFANGHPSKGLSLLQQAVAALPPGSVHLHIHGPCQGADNPAWSFHGAYVQGDLAQLMRDMDVVALPSLWDENQPMVALEARAFGKALIVSDAGGLPELVKDGVDGWIFPAGNPEDWAEGIAILAADRSKAREASHSSQPPPSAEAMSSAYLHAYRRALHKETFAPALTAGSPVEDNVPSRP